MGKEGKEEEESGGGESRSEIGGGYLGRSKF